MNVNGKPTLVTINGVRTWNAGGDINIGANDLVFTNVRLEDAGDPYLSLLEDTGSNYAIFRCLYAHTSGIEYELSATGYFRAQNVDNAYVTFHARDSTVGLAEVARLVGAADPYLSMGGSQEHKFYYSGLAELGAEVGFGAEGDLTIATGAVAVTKVYHSIVVEGGAGTGNDQLDTATGGAEGQILILKPNTSGGSDTVTIADGTGSNTFILAGGANFAMDHIDDRIMFIHNGTEWVEISRSSNS